MCACVQVLTEGDAFTMAFHDPIDAITWALDVQHRLLLLPCPAHTSRCKGDVLAPLHAHSQADVQGAQSAHGHAYWQA